MSATPAGGPALRRSGVRQVAGALFSDRYALILGFFGFVMRGVDNWAHLGGFAGGFLAGVLLDPRKEESGNHRLAAVVCLGLTVASIVASLVIPVPGLR